MRSGSYAKINIKNKITSNCLTLSFNFFPTLIKDEAQVIFSSNDKKNNIKIYTKKIVYIYNIKILSYYFQSLLVFLIGTI